jgi:hypothetical protein
VTVTDDPLAGGGRPKEEPTGVVIEFLKQEHVGPDAHDVLVGERGGRDPATVDERPIATALVFEVPATRGQWCQPRMLTRHLQVVECEGVRRGESTEPCPLLSRHEDASPM